MKDNNISKRKPKKKFGENDYFEETPDLEAIVAALMKAEEDPEYNLEDYIEPFGELFPIPSYNAVIPLPYSYIDDDDCPTLESIAAAIMRVIENDLEEESKINNNSNTDRIQY